MSAPVPTPDQTNVLRLSSSGGKKDLGRSRSDSTEATPPALQSYRHTPRSAAKLYPRGMQRALEASGGSMVSEPGIVSPVNDSFTSRSIKTLHLDDGTDFYAPSNAETKLEPLDNDFLLNANDLLLLAQELDPTNWEAWIERVRLTRLEREGALAAARKIRDVVTPKNPELADLWTEVARSIATHWSTGEARAIIVPRTNPPSAHPRAHTPVRADHRRLRAARGATRRGHANAASRGGSRGS